MSEQEWKEITNNNAVDIKKNPDVPYIGTYKGRIEIETKIGKQTIWQFVDEDFIPFGVYGFTMLNRIMENVQPGTDCRLTYTGTKNLKTKFGQKDVHQVRIEIRPGAGAGDMMAPEEVEAAYNMLALALKHIDLTFQENGHVHLLNGHPVPGCTSISGLFQDDGWKFAWPVKLMGERLLEWWNSYTVFHPGTDEFEDAIKKAKNAWREKRDSAASKGTSAHEYIQDYIRHGVKVPPTVDEEVRHCFNEFLKWEAKYNPTYMAVELQVGSELNNHAGILDLLCKIDDKVTLVDHKTSKAIKPEYNIQLAGLVIALEEMGCHVDVRAVLHLPKNLKEGYEYKIIKSDLEQDKKAFLAGLEFYRHRNIFFSRTKQ